MNLKQQLEMQCRYAAQARGEKPLRFAGQGGFPSAQHPNETVIERTKSVARPPSKPRKKTEEGE